MAKIALYAHGGSGNHGCEAIVRGLAGRCGLTREAVLLSNRPEEDCLYGLGRLLTIKRAPSKVETSFIYRVKAHLSGDIDRYYYRQRYRLLGELATGCERALSIGGDNYCYPGMAQEMMVMRQVLSRSGLQTVLMGCSIDTSLLRRDILKDLTGYEEIVCRESLTFKSLQALGFQRISLQPDPAFYMACREEPLPKGFIANNSVGINISPLILRCSRNEDLVLRNYCLLIKFILDNTDMSVALIPHVVWDSNDDRQPLRRLFDAFSETGRVVMVEDASAEVLKGYISRCRFLVAARTHASIAGYSTGVPTLVLGYSIKSRGLARDLFGSEKKYVLPVEELREENGLMTAFRWMLNHEDCVRNHYAHSLPVYLAGDGFEIRNHENNYPSYSLLQ